MFQQKSPEERHRYVALCYGSPEVITSPQANIKRYAFHFSLHAAKQTINIVNESGPKESDMKGAIVNRKLKLLVNTRSNAKLKRRSEKAGVICSMLA
ncbi:unnamed protein product [Sphagnum balticum]